uniref:Uncharacterized protein n=1 Tax=Spongospora subterranea TaxID=70186 RepID=A0A0H5QS18_9EUKA|eukprot:CRZ04457.1 hypothetical protein [Spongospora subterranea]
MKHQNTAETYFHSAQHNPIHCRHLVVRGREFGSWVIADPLRTGSMGVFEMISDRIAGLQRAVFNTIGWSEVDLNGRHAVVVGGGRGIGYSLVKLLVEAGCIVHVIDVHQKSLTKIETEFQFLKTKSVRTYTVDVADEQSFEDAANKIKVDIAPDFISILVHSVAVVNNCSVDELSPEQLLTIFRVNLFSWYY